MNTQLQELFDLCKCSVRITKDQHKSYYEPLGDYLAKRLERGDITEEEYWDMVKADTVYEVQAYPDTPIGFHRAYSANLDEAVAGVVEAIKSRRS